jgi:hypothetical protein
MKNWKKYGTPPSPIAYVGQSDSLMYINTKTGHSIDIANIFGMGSYNVILIKGFYRDVLADGLSKTEAIKFAKNWMNKNPEG